MYILCRNTECVQANNGALPTTLFVFLCMLCILCDKIVSNFEMPCLESLASFTLLGLCVAFLFSSCAYEPRSSLNLFCNTVYHVLGNRVKESGCSCWLR